MKYFIFFLLLISGAAYGQSTYFIRADTIRFQKTGGSTVFFLENATKAKNGAYLRNYSGGRTDFGYAVDSASLSGSNLTFWRGLGTQNITLALPGGGSDVVAKPGILKVTDSIRPEVRYFNQKYSGLYEQGEISPYSNSFLVKQLNAGLWPTDRDGIAIINVDDVTLMSIGGWFSTSTDSVFKSEDGGVTWSFLWLAPWGADHSVPTFKADDDFWYHIGGDYQGTTAQKLSVWRSQTPLVQGSWVQVTNAAQYSSRILFDAIGFNNALYNYGGQYTTNWSDGATDTVWRSIDGGATWSYWATAPDGIFDKNISKTSVIRGGRVYFIAGGRYDDGTPANRTFDPTVYSTADFITFRQENSIPSAGVQYPAVFLINGMVGYFGGGNAGGNTNNIGLMDRDGQWHVAANYDSTRTAIPITHAVGVTNFKDRILFISGNAFNRAFAYYKTRYITNDSVIHFAPHRINERTTFSEFTVSLTTMLSNNLMADPVNDSMYRYDNAANGVNIQLDGTNDEIRFGTNIGPVPYARVGIKTGFRGRIMGNGRWAISSNSTYDPGVGYLLGVDGNIIGGRIEAQTAFDIAGSQVLNVVGLRGDLFRAGGFSTVTIPNLLQFGALTGAPALKRVNTTDLQLMDANEANMDSRLGIGIAPTARLHILDGTATAGTAPLKFTAGVNLTSAEAGAMEWDGSRLYITQTTGPTRRTIAYTDEITAITENTYTPTLFNTTNIAASTAFVTHYQQVGNTVHVYGEVTIDATTALTISELGMSLPVASALVNTFDLAGTASFEDNTSVQISGDVANSRAKFRFNPQTATNNKYSFHFTYKFFAP